MFNKLRCIKGFSVIELCFVVLIFTLIVLLITPGLQCFYVRHSLGTSVLRLQREVQTLGQEALAKESSTYSINFYPSMNYYTVNGPKGSENIKMPSGIDLVFTNFDTEYYDDRIYFSARGIPTQGGTITLKSNLTRDFKYIIVAPVTGRTRVSDTPP